MGKPVDDALLVSWVCVAWSIASGVASLVVGIIAGSLSLGGLGASVLIDVISSAVLIWRFRRERHHGVFPVHAERRAQVVAATGLLAIGVVLVASGVEHLATHAEPSAPFVALGLAALNLLVLPLLARWKYRVATAVKSPALRTDAHITMVGTSTSGLALIGLGLDRSLGWWWADAVAAIIIGLVASGQGRRSAVTEPSE